MSDEDTRIHREEVVRSLRAQEQVLERLLGIAYKVTRKERGVRDLATPPEEDRNGVYALAVLGHLQNLVEAVRALKPAPTKYDELLANAARVSLELVDKRDEVERLQAKVADDALTLGAKESTLQATNAELQRFRDREEKVTALLAQWAHEVTYNQDLADRYSALHEAVAAVRDFKGLSNA